ncbi:unnamed protein product [Owenia fusiformis]|uniref:Uncharacterized protein n=1 Tax=Owenia fusiformis TaxID=6347 RepID=A0A8J1TYN5_OWEFU|nr:unnamed protein product [Owenia fusiformis]
MKLYMLFVICLVLCLITESLDAKKNKEKKMKKKMRKKNKMSKTKATAKGDMPRLRLQYLVDRLPSKDIIPILNETAAVEVKFGISLQNVLELDSSLIKAVIWLTFSWKNEFLQWDPRDYGGINIIRVPENKIWTPDVELFNSVRKADMIYDVLTVVSSDGSVTWIPSMAITASCKRLKKTANGRCKINCPLKFGSWTYDGNRLNLTSNSDTVDVSSYVENEDWELVENTQKRHSLSYECCPEPYVDVTGNLTFVEKDDRSDED